LRLPKTQKQTHSIELWHSTTALAASAALTRLSPRSQNQRATGAPAALSRSKQERRNYENAIEKNQTKPNNL
jgi:hypothetical protein